MLRHEAAGWSNPKVLTILTLIFLCGAAFGTAVTRGFLHSKMSVVSRRQNIQAAQRMAMDRLKTELNLTPDQEQTVDKILDDYGKYYQNIEDEREDVAEHGRERILSILNEQQKKRFLELFNSPSLLAPDSPLR
jgi:hydroxylamine reductase (hybrid-cluster protein)